MQANLCFTSSFPRTGHPHHFVQSSLRATTLIRPLHPKPLPARSSRSSHAPFMSTEEKKSTPSPDRNDGRATSGLFGIRLQTNGDVIKFGFIAIAVAYGIKTGFQLLGAPDLLAGQLTTGFVSVFALVAWVSTYVFRVGTKGMTYAQQLRDYEDAVIQKRYEELTEEELAALGEELNDDI